MNHRTAGVGASIVLASLTAVACVDITAGGASVVDTIDKRFTVNGTPRVKLGTFDGSVEVSSWDRPEVQVTIEKRAPSKDAADRIIVSAEQSGNDITVDVRQAPGLHVNFGGLAAHLTVHVPATASIDASTGDGRIVVREVEGELEVRTGDGAIRLEGITGPVEAASGDGRIDIDGVIGRLRARTGDGRLHVRAEGTMPAADWNLSTGDGSVLVEVPDGFGAELDATTGDGRVLLRDLPFSGTVDAHERGRARGRIGAGGGSVTIRSGDGSITVSRVTASPEVTR